ncbi:fumarate reductase subunit FrdD [Rhodococcus sp. UNC363MFTsu5.1]|uniref:fumarate reductase subunit FrdD n=1 Tax=Rhodococcus sp. UNC363MFTsu5.1 TaxID=1449069 RepID=UPI0004842136|nr:fumarate reductase subunit FrdD [Rhodococcus sp. UNC363MFTsu5.1]
MTTSRRESRRPTAEPLAWLAFSAGGMAAALLIPVLILLFGIAIPLGWIAAPEYTHLHSVLRHPITVVVLIGLCVLALFHAAHRLRFTLWHGLRLQRARGAVTVACYGGAAVGSVVAAYLLIRG